MAGMFGTPYDYGVNMGAQSPLLQAANVQPLPQMAPQSGGMFGAGGVGRGIAGMIGDFLMQRAGMQPVYAPMMMKRQEMAMEEAQNQRQQDAELKRQEALIDYKGPEQGENERLLARYMDPNTPPAEKQMIGSMLQHPMGVDVTMPDGSVQRQYVYPGSMPQQAPTAPVGKITPIGGSTPQASSGFPGGYY